MNYDIVGLLGVLKHKFPTDYYVIEITHMHNRNIFTNLFDIPKTFLENINIINETVKK